MMDRTDNDIPANVPQGQALWIVPPNIDAMMTGCKWARILPNGETQLTYTDGTQETGHLLPDIPVPNLPGIVAIVQGQRVNA